jgi:hypothetical protein
MRSGLARHGIGADVVAPDTLMTADMAICWGWRKGAKYRSQGREVLVMERGYLGDRFAWTSLGWNGLNGRAQWPDPRDDGERFERNFGHLRQDWRRNDAGHALIVGQVQGDAALANTDIKRWYGQARRAMEGRGFKVVFRPHPESLKRGHDIGPLAPLTIGGTLAEALRDAAVAVTWNSNTGVEAVLAGVPTITCDDGAMARPVTAEGLDAELVTPDRDDWCRRMAWRQWTMDEITSGEAWEAVKGAH